MPGKNNDEIIHDHSNVQISDSHMDFNKPANPDVAVTAEATRRLTRTDAGALF